jgi:leader peptidase (prepilin peptidase)/N-methyltransferase
LTVWLEAATVAWLGVFTVTDLRGRVVPDRLVLAALATLLALVAALAVRQGTGVALEHAVAAGLLFAVGAAVALMSHEGAFGGGDVKVLGLIGLGLGALGILAVAAGQLLAGLYVAARYVVAKVSPRQPIPLVPFLALGSALAVAAFGR